MNAPLPFSADPAWHALPPARHRGAWIGSGLAVQLVATAIPALYVAVRAEKTQAVITKATLLLVTHQAVHTPRGVLVLAVAAVLFAIGSVLLARPYVHSWLTLVVAVPVAAVVGLLVLGVGALVLALIVFVVWSNLDVPDLSSNGRRRRRERRRG